MWRKIWAFLWGEESSLPELFSRLTELERRVSTVEERLARHAVAADELAPGLPALQSRARPMSWAAWRAQREAALRRQRVQERSRASGGRPGNTHDSGEKR
jgi:hypothetical protein